MFFILRMFRFLLFAAAILWVGQLSIGGKTIAERVVGRATSAWVTGGESLIRKAANSLNLSEYWDRWFGKIAPSRPKQRSQQKVNDHISDADQRKLAELLKGKGL